MFRHLFFAVALFCLFLPAVGFARTGQDVVTLMLPSEVIKESIQSVLPLPINPGNGHLQGKLVLNSIDQLVMKDNAAHVRGLVLGRNIVLTTRVGNQDLRMQVGTVRLLLTCDFTFRFDPKLKVLYVTPHLQPPAPTLNQKADAILPFLVLLNDREYPVSLDALQTFNATVSGRNFAVDMEPADISITGEQVVLKMKPAVRKTN